MPGAYEKQMHGEHYELVLSSVQKCRQLMNDQNFKELTFNLRVLLLLQNDRSKKVIEEFCYAGGFRLMCDILKLRSINNDIGDVSIILNNFSSLLAIEFDPYDDDLGSLPLLTYFLCERHTHYIDIVWNSHELTLMSDFLEAHISILSSIDVPESERVVAVNNLYGALLSYPPHRVVQSAAGIFTPENCIQVLASLRQLPSLWCNAEGRRRIAQLLLSVTSFGLGIVITADVPHSQILMAVNRHLVPGLRCPCGRCEFFRRLQRVARERDEFGVTTAAGAKKEICSSFVKAGIVQFLSDILNEVQTSVTTNRSKCLDITTPISNENENPSASISDTFEKNAKDGIATTTELVDKNVNHPNILKPQPKSILTKMNDKEGLDLRCRLRRQEDFLVLDTGVDVDDMKLDDQTKLLVTQTIWLCSFVCEEENKLSILSIDNFLLTTALLRSLNLSDLRYTFNPTTGEFLPGIRACIETLCALTLRTENHQLDNLTSRLRPTIEVVLQQCCLKFSEACGSLSRQWTPSMSIFAPIFSVMLSCVYLATLKDSPVVSRVSRGNKCLISLSEPLLLACIDACRCLHEGYEWGGSQMDERIFIEALLQSMTILAGGLESSKCSEQRRRLLPSPHPNCGFMASAGRWLLRKFDDTIAQGEGCVIIRTLGSITISRAEKAVAIQLPDTFKPQKSQRGFEAYTESGMMSTAEEI